MHPKDLQDFAARYTDAWCSQDAASVAAFFAPDGLLTINGGSPNLGRVAITASAEGFMVAFPDLLVEMNGLDVDGERVVYRWDAHGDQHRSGRHGGGACASRGPRPGPLAPTPSWPARWVRTTWPTTIASCTAPPAGA
jgi:uncharacterized protein (TIGR02246 family)